MMQMSCLEELKALSPEHIQENGEEEIRKKLKVVADCLQHVLEQSF